MARARKTEYPWERQPGEGYEAYEAFRVYYKMREKRSLAKVAAALGKSKTLMENWARKWDWVERSRAYDNELEREAFKATVSEIRKMNKQQASTGVLLQQLGIEALKKLNADKMEAKTLLQFIVQGAAIERRSRTADIEVQTQSQSKEAEDARASYADDGLAAALADAAKKVWKK